MPGTYGASASPAAAAGPPAPTPAPAPGASDQILWPGQQGEAEQQHQRQPQQQFGSPGQEALHQAAHPYGAPQSQFAPSRPGGTVYGNDPGPSSAPPLDSGNPYGAGTPGLRNVGGPANNQHYYPNQQQPAYPAPNPVETSGSLTGHILSQGRADTPAPNNRTAKVVIILVVVLVVMVGLGLLAATLFGDMINDLLGGLGG